MTDEVVFRDAYPADLDRVLEAQRETAALTYDEAPSETTLDSIADRTRVALDCPDSTHHRIRVAAALAGSTAPGGFPPAGITYAWIERRSGDTAFLVDFHVSEAERNSAIAGELFDEILAVARSWECGRIEFRVGRNNHRALRFFRRRGATLDSSEDADRGPCSFFLPLEDPDPPSNDVGARGGQPTGSPPEP